jgi:hypothetical protein
MKSLEPPSVATWLLVHFTCGRRNDSLIGDILEEYQFDPSRAWFWRQAVGAILASFGTEIRANGLLAVRAVTIGWVTLYLGRFLLGSWPDMLSSPFDRRVPEAFDPLGHNGFIWWIFWIPVTATSGWIVGRFHRGHRAMVLIFSGSVLFWDLRMLPWICALSIDVFSNSRYLPYLISNLAGFTLPPASILLAGLWNGPHRNDSLPRNTWRLSK